MSFDLDIQQVTLQSQKQFDNRKRAMINNAHKRNMKTYSLEFSASNITSDQIFNQLLIAVLKNPNILNAANCKN
jgi:hypothetical protein